MSMWRVDAFSSFEDCCFKCKESFVSLLMLPSFKIIVLVFGISDIYDCLIDLLTFFLLVDADIELEYVFGLWFPAV